jgi:uncharacterized protein DUF973/zinc ribbon protein
MATRFCASCGQSMAANARFCASCGAAVGGGAQPSVPIGRSTPYSPPTTATYSPYRPSYPGAPGAAVASSGADKLALSNVTLAAILGLAGVLISYAEISVTQAVSSFTGATTTSTGGSFTLDLSSLYILAALAGAGIVLTLTQIWLYRGAFRTLARNDPRFSTPASLSLLAFVALLIIIALAAALIDLVYQAVVCAGAGNPITSACINAGSILGLVVLIGVTAIVFLVGYIGLLIGIWRLGTRYGDGKFKIGAVFLILPFLNLVGLVLILIASNSAKGRLQSGPSSLPFG